MSNPQFFYKLFQDRGRKNYGEQITMQEHMLQSAWFAKQQQESPELILACLFHDIGHLLHKYGDTIADEGIDGFHEQMGADFLKKYFSESVSEPVRLHVDAKRYLCHAKEGYYEKLSDASKHSLTLQGGAMDATEAKQFESGPYFEAALRLRTYDEMGKLIDFSCGCVEDYESMISDHLRDSAFVHA